MVVLPEGQRTTVARIETYDGPMDRAPVGLSVSVHLADHVDVSRGDLIASAAEPPDVVTQLEATVCWFGERHLRAGDRLRVKHTTRVTPARVSEVRSRLDVNALALEPVAELADNDIGVVAHHHGHAPGHRPLPARPDHRQLRAGGRGHQRHGGGRHGGGPRARRGGGRPGGWARGLGAGPAGRLTVAAWAAASSSTRWPCGSPAGPASWWAAGAWPPARWPGWRPAARG